MEKTKEQILMDAINEFRGVDTTVGFIVMAFDESAYQSHLFNINEYSAIAAVSILKNDLLNKDLFGEKKAKEQSV
jgi:hypothetical protein